MHECYQRKYRKKEKVKYIEQGNVGTDIWGGKVWGGPRKSIATESSLAALPNEDEALSQVKPHDQAKPSCQATSKMRRGT